VLWSFIYLRIGQKSVRDNWHIVWGLRFPSVSLQYWSGVQPPLPGAPHAFVAAGCDKEPRLPIGAFSNRGKVPSGWSFDEQEGELIIPRLLNDFRHDPDGWTIDFAEWVASEANRVLPTLAEMAKLVA